MKSTNLKSIVEAKDTLSLEKFESFLKIFGIKYKAHEFETLNSLVNSLAHHGLQDFNSFFIGYTIKHISKEFDLLRFGVDSIINIELKSVSTLDRIKNQLIKNSYYLSFLGKEIHNFTFVSESNTLYKLDKNGNLIETSLEELVGIIENQNPINIANIDALFIPSNYLVSPFNSTDRFIEGNYFLTDHQENIKKEILTLFKSDKSEKIIIKGKPGTGKTLLTYDIAKHFLQQNKNVLIIHCGKLNDGHIALNDNHFNVISISNYKDYLDDYDIIIIDEAQRIYKDQLEEIINYFSSINSKFIFSYDPNQIFSPLELNRHIPDYLENELQIPVHRLKDRIRTNKEAASFILKLFNLNHTDHEQNYDNIHVQYFNSDTSARIFSQQLKEDGWEILNFTNSRYNRLSYDAYQSPFNYNSHQVIGQEFDKVVVFIDKHFYYDNRNKLASKDIPGSAGYSLDKMLYQNITRARLEIMVIVIDNEVILDRISDILNKVNTTQTV